MPPRRLRCRRCRSRIDPDHGTCPFCEAEDPLRNARRWRRLGAFTALSVLAVIFFITLAVLS